MRPLQGAVTAADFLADGCRLVIGSTSRNARIALVYLEDILKLAEKRLSSSPGR